jgi:exodeoxyribonuclease VII large subunit
MEQLAMFDPASRWTVSSLTRHLKKILEAKPELQGVWVVGEISNLSRPPSGHIYFTLKDSNASLKSVMWKTDTSRLRFALQDGMAVEAHGSISIYEVSGQYQLYTDRLLPVGEGVLYQEFLRLKGLLEAEGLFDPDRKRPIPAFPRRIGIVTSPSGAALRDMLHTLRRRMPLAEVTLAPTQVQGEEAPQAIVKAIQNLNRVLAPDVILLGRGGGSIEDLWAFNDERVVRAVCESQVPIISGVGHETDFTLVDFAADLRAPTPTAAAELATALTVADLIKSLSEKGQILAENMKTLFQQQRNLVEELKSDLGFFSPLGLVQTERQRVDELNRRGNAGQEHRLQLVATRLMGLKNRLAALSPLAVLQRGYAIITKNNLLVTRTTQVEDRDVVQIQLWDGEFDAQVLGDG